MLGRLAAGPMARWRIRGVIWRALGAMTALVAGAVEPAVGQIRPRVVGGTDAPRGKYPWMVSVARRAVSDLYEAHHCGGVLVHPHWVLTAAHCVDTDRPTTIDVVVGAHNLQTDEPPMVRRVAVREIVLHPDYDAVTSDSDLALLVLAEPVVTVTPLEIIDWEVLCEPGRPAVVLGWGATTGNGTNFPAVLQEVGVPLVALAVANAVPAFDGTLTENMLPAGPEEGGRDSCQGDSGGPLIVEGAAPGVPMLAGVVSFGADTLDCGAPGGYGIYTRVVRFRRWIYNLMRPAYGEWEHRTGRVGERRDLDGDGIVHWEEFVRGMAVGDGGATPESISPGHDPHGVMAAVFSFRRRVGPEVRTELHFSESLATPGWAVDIDRQLTGPPIPVPSMPGVETVTVRSPLTAGRDGYFRVTGRPAPVYVSGPRLIEPGQLLDHTTHDLDPVVGGTRAKEYSLQHPPQVGGLITLTARSNAFDTRLDMIDAVTGEVLATAIGSVTGATDAFLNFTVTESRPLIARVRPATGAATTTGRFSLHYGVTASAGRAYP